MSSSSILLRNLLVETKDGEWGKAEPFDGSVEMAVIRGTDFDTAKKSGLEGVPVRHIAGKAAGRKTLQPLDILIETAGGSKGKPTGKTTFLRPALFERSVLPITCASFARFLRIDATLADPEFVYWCLQSLYLSGVIETYQVQHTGIARFQFTKFADPLEINLPPIGDQIKISAFLGSIENRISLLRETNATLEAIAQALFKSWFVDFDPVRAKAEGLEPEGMDAATAALFPDSFEESELGLVPRGWGGGVLGDVGETARKQIQPNSMTVDTLYVGLEHLPRQSLGLGSWGNAERLESAKSCFEKGDILFGKLRPYFHKVVIAPFAGVCSTDILVCKSKLTSYYGFVAMHLFSTELVAYADRLSNGAKMPRVNWKDLSDYALTIPPVELAAAFSDAVQPMFDQITANVHQAQTLTKLRDTLLPRLISGQLRLPEAEAQLEAVCA